MPGLKTKSECIRALGAKSPERIRRQSDPDCLQGGDTSSMIDEALKLAAKGFHIFPLHTPDALGFCSCRNTSCTDVGKHPRTINGLSGATTDEQQIRDWWQMWPQANIGLVTGAISGLVVIDIDPRHGGAETFKALTQQHGELSEKVWANTGGGGWHLIFQHPGVRIRNNQSGKLGVGVDVRGDGGYIVAPPSLHASGKCYTWGSELPGALPALPLWLLTLLAEPTAQQIQTLSDNEIQIAEGARNKTLTSLAGSMRRRGMTEDAIYAALTVENEQRCSPALLDADVRKIAHSVSRYAPEDPVYIYPERTVMENERPDGIYFVNELSGRLHKLYEQGMTGGQTTGLPALDWYYTVKKGQWSVVTGMPGHGKSAVLDTVLHNLAELHNWRIAITSVENQPLERHAAQLISIHTGEPFAKGDIPRMSVGTLERAEKWLDERFVFVLPDEGGCTVGGILDRVLWLHKNDRPIDGVVIDPWNELEHRRPANMNETEYVSQSLTRLRRFARAYDLHLWLVAHPTKLTKDIKTGTYPVPTLYDISGSAHFRNKADMGLSVWRDMMNERSATEVHVQKVRFRECGKIGKCELYFDVVSGKFQEFPPNYSSYVAEEVNF